MSNARAPTRKRPRQLNTGLFGSASRNAESKHCHLETPTNTDLGVAKDRSDTAKVRPRHHRVNPDAVTPANATAGNSGFRNQGIWSHGPMKLRRIETFANSAGGVGVKRAFPRCASADRLFDLANWSHRCHREQMGDSSNVVRVRARGNERTAEIWSGPRKLDSVMEPYAVAVVWARYSSGLR